MDWIFIVILGVVVTALFVFKRLGLVGEELARQHLEAGAAVVDVRSVREFQSQHLPGAVNVPLDGLSEGIQRAVPDKSKVVLLHCLSGGRSEIARRMLKRMGYAQAFNLGSYNRAAAIVSADRP